MLSRRFIDKRCFDRSLFFQFVCLNNYLQFARALLFRLFQRAHGMEERRRTRVRKNDRAEEEKQTRRCGLSINHSARSRGTVRRPGGDHVTGPTPTIVPHRCPPAPFTVGNSENFHPYRFTPSSSASIDGARRPVMYAVERTAEGADWSGSDGRRTSSGCNFREKGRAGRSRTGVIDGGVGVSPIARNNCFSPRLLRDQCEL